MRDEVDDELEAALKGHFDAEGLAKGANDAVDGIELPKTGEMRMPEMDIRPESERVMQMPEMDLRPETDGPRPGSIKAQVGAAVTGGAKAPARPAPVRDTELEGLQADAKKRRDFSQLGQAVTDFTERPTNLLDYAQRLGGGGVSQAPKSKMWQENAAEGDRAIEDLAARRKSEAGMETQQATRAASADDNDPNGQTAQTYRSVLVKFAPELSEKLATATPKQMRAIAPWLEKFATENNDLLQAKAKAEVDAKVREEAAAEKKRLEAKGDERYVQGQKNADRNHEDSLAMQRAALGLRAGEIARNVDEAQAEQQVPGYTHNPKVKQAPGEVGKVRGMVASAQTISDSINELDALIEKYGTETLPTEAKARMQSLGANILAELKGEAGFQLGVLAGPDMEIMKEAIGDATSMSLGNLLGRSDTTRVKLKQSRDSMMRKLSNRMKTGGYTQDGAQGSTASDTVEITDKKGQKYSVPAAEVEAVKAELRAEGLL